MQANDMQWKNCTRILIETILPRDNFFVMEGILAENVQHLQLLLYLDF